MRTMLSLMLTASAITAVPALAQTDNFNRPDADTLGANWTQQTGTSSIVNNMATGTDLALATYNGGTGNTVSFDAMIGSSGLQYIAAVLGYGNGGDNYFIKVQGSGSSEFDQYAFYRGNNGSGLISRLRSTFTQGRVTASFTGTIATLRIDPLGGAQQVYTYNYGSGPDGTGIGLGFYGSASADNFTGAAAAPVPEPATWAMMLVGFGGIGFSLRRRSNVRTSARFA